LNGINRSIHEDHKGIQSPLSFVDAETFLGEPLYQHMHMESNNRRILLGAVKGLGAPSTLLSSSLVRFTAIPAVTPPAITKTRPSRPPNRIVRRRLPALYIRFLMAWARLVRSSASSISTIAPFLSKSGRVCGVCVKFGGFSHRYHPYSNFWNFRNSKVCTMLIVSFLGVPFAVN
jgi:hypothetical protein